MARAAVACFSACATGGIAVPAATRSGAAAFFTRASSAGQAVHAALPRSRPCNRVPAGVCPKRPMTSATESTPARAIAPEYSAQRVGRAWRSSVPNLPFWIFFTASLLFALGFSAYFFLYGVFLVHLGLGEAQIGRVTASLTLGTIGGTVL